ncbi:head maturation protease, ClpP-related [Pedobacter sp. SYP-B3415]|uniref:head maturation protease, ClpP-related n=1 Tax=Pedobacter sp. SYP-B3415 TaxID=2496641 RepID=UPI00101C00E2|nr:head maturation protease, ClpP-related [Pedobacter sp. SYP-B3415]
MAKQAHIYVYGDIFDYQGKDAPDWGCVNLRSVVDIINANPDADEFIVHINSRGGDVTEGFAIYDALINSGKTIITIVEGKCASIATVVCLAGSVRKMNENSEFMIHNAWADPFTMPGYNADDYQEMADFIREADQKILDLYVKVTGADADEIKAFMDVETFMNAEEAMALGFITEVNEPLKAVAYFNRAASPAAQSKANKKSIHMSKKTLAGKAIAALMALVGGVQAAESTLSDGTKIYYDGDLAEGTAVFTDEELSIAAADGDYTLEDGRVVTVADGAVTAIVDADDDEEPTVDAMQARITALEEENASLRAENEQSIVAINAATKRLQALKGSHTPPAGDGKTTKFRSPQSGQVRFVKPDKNKGGSK